MPDYSQRAKWESAEASAIYMLLQKWKGTLHRGKIDPGDLDENADLLAEPLGRPYRVAARTLADQFDVMRNRLPDDRWVRGYTRQFAKSLASNVAADLRSLGKNATAADIEVVFSRSRADRGGVTTVTQAISAGEIDAAEIIGKIKGSTLQVRWVIDPLSNVCKLCRSLNGAPKRVWVRKYPLGPPAHPRCRCYLEFS